MRFKSKKILNILIIKTWFAILPVRIGGETRWLEKVSVKGHYDPSSLKFIKYKFI